MSDQRRTGSRSPGSRPSGSRARRRARSPGAAVAPTKPWGLIAAAAVVVVFAVGVLTYAVVRERSVEAAEVNSAEEIDGVTAYAHAPGRHTSGAVDYEQSPPVGGRHDYQWADCTGTVYDVEVRPENAVHSLEHGAVWITYDPDLLGAEARRALTDRVEGTPGLMLSPYSGLDSAISLQSWNHQLFVDSATDPRIDQYVDFFAFNPDHTPEIGATCENAAFLAATGTTSTGRPG